MTERTEEYVARHKLSEEVPVESEQYARAWNTAFANSLHEHIKAGSQTKWDDSGWNQSVWGAPDPASDDRDNPITQAVRAEKQKTARDLQKALDKLNDTELRQYIEGLVRHLNTQAES